VTDLRRRAGEWFRSWWVGLVAGADFLVFIMVGVANVATAGRDSILLPSFFFFVAFTNAVAVVDVWRNRRSGDEVRGTYLGTHAPANPRSWGLLTVTVAQASAIPIFLMAIWLEGHSAVHNLTDKLTLVLAAVLFVIAASITIASLATHQKMVLRKTWVVLPALISLAGTIQFWYTTIYAPSHQRPVVNIVASLEPGSSHLDESRYKATIVLKNDGSAQVDILDAVFMVSRLQMTRVNQALTSAQFNDDLQPDRVAFNDPDGSYEGLVAVGRLIRLGGHLAPGQDLTTSVVFDAGSHTEGTLRLTVYASTMVDTGNTLDAPLTCISTNLHYPYTCIDLPLLAGGLPASAIADRPVVRTIIEYPPDRLPSLITTVGYLDAPEDQRKWRDFSSIRDYYPYLNLRNFTTSVEYAYPP
jgi:hypothetical protein